MGLPHDGVSRGHERAPTLLAQKPLLFTCFPIKDDLIPPQCGQPGLSGTVLAARESRPSRILAMTSSLNDFNLSISLSSADMAFIPLLEIIYHFKCSIIKRTFSDYQHTC